MAPDRSHPQPPEASQPLDRQHRLIGRKSTHTVNRSAEPPASSTSRSFRIFRQRAVPACRLPVRHENHIEAGATAPSARGPCADRATSARAATASGTVAAHSRTADMVRAGFTGQPRTKAATRVPPSMHTRASTNAGLDLRPPPVSLVAISRAPPSRSTPGQTTAGACQQTDRELAPQVPKRAVFRHRPRPLPRASCSGRDRGNRTI